jgi:hypothetical protein
MKGLCLAVLLSISSFFISHAQFRVAIIGGAHTADVLEKTDLPNYTEYSKGFSSRTGAHFGFIADIPFSAESKLFFQPGLMLQNVPASRTRF